MNILALICARGGSKRLPGKNKRLLAGKPLINWSIEIAKLVPEITDILVSTDDEEIADIARRAGATVPWIRPSVLATDNATSMEVALHALDYYEKNHDKVDGLLLLQPTSPFRNVVSIRHGIEKYKQNNQRPIIGVSPAKEHPLWCFRIEGDVMTSFMQSSEANLQSQDLPPVYVVNGMFYLISPTQFRKEQSFFGSNALPLISTDPFESIDIDTEWDWQCAEKAVELKAQKIT